MPVTQAQELVGRLPWVSSVEVQISSATPHQQVSVPPGLQGVANIVAVSSCKGGEAACLVAHSPAELHWTIGLHRTSAAAAAAVGADI